MDNSRELKSYGIRARQFSEDGNDPEPTTKHRFDITVVEKRRSSSGQWSLGLDFTFNTLKSVKKVDFQDRAPWYREVSDGFNWIMYCRNPGCAAKDQL